MIRWSVIVLGLAVLVVAGLPPVLGMVYQQQVTAQFESAPQNPVMQVELVNYERGLYESSGTVLLSLTDEYVGNLEKQLTAQQQAEPQTPESRASTDEILEFISGNVRLNFDVRHGPLSMGDEPGTGLAFYRITLSPEDGRLAEFQASAAVPHLFRLDGIVGFDGVTEFSGGMPAITSADGDVSFDFSGLDLVGQYDAGAQALQMDGSSESFIVEGPGTLMELNRLELTTDQQLLDEFLWTGDARLDLGEMSLMMTAGEQPVRFVATDSGFVAAIDANDAGDRLNMAIDYFVGSAAGGQEIDLADMALGFRLTNVDVEAYKLLMKEAQTFDSSTPEGNEAGLQKMMPIFAEMLRGSPGLELSPVKFISQGEPFMAEMRMTINSALLDEAALSQLAQNPMLAIAALSAEGQLQAPESLMSGWVASSLQTNLEANLPADSTMTDEQVAQAAQAQAAITIETLVAQGMIERSDSQLRSDFNYADGLLTVRGNVIPLGGP